MARPSLNDLEGTTVGAPASDSLVDTKCHRLRKKPVDDFTVEDLRIMIGEGIGLEHLMLPALSALERDPMAEGNYYPGDLLASVIGCAQWLEKRPEMFGRAQAVAKRAVAGMGNDALGGELLLFIAKKAPKVKA
jgi:hypothetical protein